MKKLLFSLLAFASAFAAPTTPINNPVLQGTLALNQSATTGFIPLANISGFLSPIGQGTKVVGSDGTNFAWVNGGGGGGGNPGGSNTQVQFNDNGSFGGSSLFTFNKSTGATAITGPLTATTVNGLTLSSSTGTITITNAKVFSVTQNITLSSDGTGTRTLNIGAGGTLGAGAFQPQTVLTGTANQIAVSNSGVGATQISIVTNPTLPGNVTVGGGNITSGVGGILKTTGSFQAISGSAIAAVEPEGTNGITSVYTNGWQGSDVVERMRLSFPSTNPQSSPPNLLMLPYQYGMLLDYPGTFEMAVNEFSVHRSADGTGHGYGYMWVGDDDDGGGVHLWARSQPTFSSTFSEIDSTTFGLGEHGDLRFGVFSSGDFFRFKLIGGADLLTINGLGRLAATGDIATSQSVGGIMGFVAINANAAGYSTLNLINSGASGRDMLVGLGGHTAAATALRDKFFIFDNTGSTTLLTIDSGGSAVLPGTVTASSFIGAGNFTTESVSGIQTLGGAKVTTANAMGALAIDVTKALNTKTIAIDSTMTFSGTPGANYQWFPILITNSDTSAHTITIPSSVSIGRSGTITTVIIPASGWLFLQWLYDGTRYFVFNDPPSTTGTGPFVLSSGGTFDVSGATGLPDGGLTLTDVTTNNVSTSKHGFAPKGDGNAAHFLDATGNYSTPSGSGGNVNAGGTLTINGVVLGAGTQSVAVTSGIATDGTSVLILGVNSTTAGGVKMFGGTSGNVTLSPTAAAGSGVTLTLPAATDTLVGKATPDTLTNKTLTSPVINGATSSGSTSIDLSGNSGTFKTPTGTTTVSTSLSGIVKAASGVLSAVTAPSGAIVGDTDTQTLTNKRVTARITTITSNAAPTVNTDNCDVVSITALAADITGMNTNLSGSPQPFDQLEYAITGTAARAITWNTSGTNFTAGPVALPTTTVTTKTLHVYFERNAANTTWLCMASSSDT